MALYADILLPLALSDCLTYEVSDRLVDTIKEGQAVEVNVGRQKHYTGLVWRLHDNKPSFDTKPITAIVGKEIIVDKARRELWEWVAEYYMCPLGAVMRMALPSQLKASGMDEEEFRKDLYRPKEVVYVRLTEQITTEEQLNAILEKLDKKAKRQYEALMAFCEAANSIDNILHGEVRRELLNADTVVLNALAKKEIISLEQRVEEYEPNALHPDIAPLTQTQQSALESINEQFKTFQTVLLHGITGSGKTEIYMHLVESELANGNSVLYIMPEMAMTEQLIARMERAFGTKVTVWHSALTQKQRTETFLRLTHSSGGEIVMGLRQAVFLPLNNLGLIIVDEEHDRSFKQEDSAPRYSARDVAVWLSSRGSIRTLLGSATPSVESYYNASTGKYGLTTLTERYGNGSLPQIVLSDTNYFIKRNERKEHFNKDLRDAVERSLADSRQVMLFQNRRGYSPYVACSSCGEVVRCPVCNVTLTFHRHSNSLLCHYCGYSTPPISHCGKCGGEIKLSGMGTEKIEQSASILFPAARIARLDRDTATPRHVKATIDEFEKGETDILIGTQIITKGFDFSGIKTVGVMNADPMLSQPDFRAWERTFQMLTQVAGRAGRSDNKGVVYIQTAEPDNSVLRQVADHDYRAMYDRQIAERRPFFLPPFGRLIEVTLRGKGRERIEMLADRLAGRLRLRMGRDSLTGPYPPTVEHVGDLYSMVVLLRSNRKMKASEQKTMLKEELQRLFEEQQRSDIRVIINVDPQ